MKTKQDRDYFRARENRLKKAGICIVCAKNKSRTMKTKCQSCQDKASKRSRDWYAVKNSGA